MSAAKTFKRVSLQHQLSDYLQAELLHTLGAYQVAGSKLEELSGDLRSETLAKIVKAAGERDMRLKDLLHSPAKPGVDPCEYRRHPSPSENSVEPPDESLLLRVCDFYSTAAAALYLRDEALRGECAHEPRDLDGRTLGEKLAVVHDPQRRGGDSDTWEAPRSRRNHIARTLHRLDEVNALIPENVRPPQRTAPELLSATEPRDFRAILHDHIDTRTPHHALHLTVLEALSDAHVWMHHAEHLGSQSFGTMLTEIPRTHAEMEAALRRSVVLNTFVYVVGRAAPWIFTESEEEREYVLHNYKRCCKTLTPTYCTWIGHQLSLLALHRRAYSRWTLGERDDAYRDFHKLIRLLRDLRQRVERRAVRVPGTKTLIEGLTGIAEYHIGRIYRGQHAHRIALRYFERASLHLKGWEGHEEIGHILKNSRWRLHLLISQGKASYELGQQKMSLLYYARAWRAFLLLADSESHSTANIEVVTEVIKWLDHIKNDPVLSKTELSRRLQPLVEQFETVYSPMHLRLLAADIMMRLGHVLFILKLPPVGWVAPADLSGLPPDPRHELARRCLQQAVALDKTSTLIAADLLKIDYDLKDEDGDEEPTLGAPNTSLSAQWPAGSGRFEEAARIIEYILQRWLILPHNRAQTSDQAQLKLARELLGSFLAHTDSSNVKLAQVYRYLMQEPRQFPPDASTDPPTMDIVCLRRYSSFFPFLPRPASFRALGGGYLVQVRKDGDEPKPFGIAIDPGPDFIDNLYRCGYGLADIHMIVLTHDHADHTASVDALLALLGIRGSLGDDTFKMRRLIIVGNESVVKRYRFFNRAQPVRKKLDKGGKPVIEDGKPVPAQRGDSVRVMSFKQFNEVSCLRDSARRKRVKKVLLWPETLEIEPVKTVDHYDATGHIAQGFLLSIGDDPNRSSVLFTGDTGPAPEGIRSDEHYWAGGKKTLAEAASSADLVVAHLSSVPMRELRDLAGLASNGLTGQEPTEADEVAREFIELWERAAAAVAKVEEHEVSTKEAHSFKDGAKRTKFLLQQLQFGFHSLPGYDQAVPLSVSPLGPTKNLKQQSEKHLYLSGLLALARDMVSDRPPDRPPLLIIGELREELGTFRTRIARRVTKTVFKPQGASTAAGEKAERDPENDGIALTADIGLRVRLSRRHTSVGARIDDEPGLENPGKASILCTTCDLDNDLIATERFHAPGRIREVCVKGENEGVFYNCLLHDPGHQPEQPWVESVERYDVFGD